MKKIWIIIGVVAILILILGGVWWYLLMNGRPEGMPNIPNPFGTFGGDGGFVPQDTENENLPENNTVSLLRRISDTPVAGAGFFERNGVLLVRYIERGTGHIFEVDTSTGASTRITNTTVPRTTDALWSKQGTRVAVTAETSAGEARTFLYTLERNDEGVENIVSSELPSGVRNVGFSETGDTLYYSIHTTAGSTGYRVDLKTDVRTTMFSSPLRDIAVVWEPELVLYTTPSGKTGGFAYETSSFVRVAGNRLGLMVVPTHSDYVLTYLENDTLLSFGPSPTTTPLSLSLLPEKCAADSQRKSILWCGAEIVASSGALPDGWYQGLGHFNDYLWQVDVYDGSATLLSMPTDDAFESIDVTNMTVDSESGYLTFINKRTGLLWLFEIPEV